MLRTCFSFLIILFSCSSVSLLFSQSYLAKNVPDLLEELEIAKEDTHRARVLNELSSGVIRDDTEMGLAYAEEALELSEKEDFAQGIADAKSNLAYAANVQGMTDSAIKLDREVFQTYHDLGQLLNQGNAALRLGAIYERQSQTDSAMFWYKRAVEIGENCGDLRCPAKALAGVGNTFKTMSQYDSAKVYFREALTRFAEIGNKYYISGTLNNLATCYLDQGEMAEAQLLLLSALKAGQGVLDSTNIAIYYVNLSQIYSEAGKYEKSMQLTTNAYQVFERIGHVGLMALCQFNLALDAEQMGDNRLTSKYFLRAAELYQQLDDPWSTALAYESLAWVAESEENYQLALEYELKAAKLKEELGENKELVEIYARVSKTALLAKNPDLGVKYAQKSLAISEELGLTVDQKFVLLNLSENYAALDEYKKAYDTHLKFMEVKDSLMSFAIDKSITEARTKYETEAAEQKSRILRQKNEIQSLALSRGYYIIGTLGGILLLLLGVILFRVRIFSFNKAVANDILKAILARLQRKPFLFVKVDGQMVRILEEEILWIKAAKDYAEIFLIGKRLLVHSTMKNLEAQLPPKDFLRVHRSYIVRIDQIESMKGKSSLIIQEEKIPVGETYKNSLAPILEKMKILNK